MSLLEFDTENHYDFLAITFGREVTKDLTYEWSGLGTSIKPFECDNYMWLRFKTNGITTGRVRKGFKIQYRAVNKNQIARKQNIIAESNKNVTHPCVIQVHDIKRK